MDTESLSMLEDALRKTMAGATGRQLDIALTELGWLDMLDEMPDTAIPLVFRLLGETGAHAPVLNDVVLHDAGREPGGVVPLPYAGGKSVVWQRTDEAGAAIDELPIQPAPQHDPVPLIAGRVALGWWLVGTGRAMLSLARQHALDRVQFGRPVAGFQAIRHRLAETLVAVEGAEATLQLTARRVERLRRAVGQGGRRSGSTDRRSALPAGARWYRLHRRACAASSRQARLVLGRVTRQRTRTDS